jgi:hypothetical protein
LRKLSHAGVWLLVGLPHHTLKEILVVGVQLGLISAK